MKTASLIASWFAIVALVVGAYLTNIGQAMAVRIGGLPGDDLQRLPSSAMLAEARAATASTEERKTMSVFHMILNVQLMLLLLVTFATVAPLLTSWKRSPNKSA